MALFNKKEKYNIEVEKNIPQKVYGIPDALEKNGKDKIKNSMEFVRIAINTRDSNSILMLSHFTSPEKYDLLVVDLNNLEGKSISEISICISEEYYKKFLSKLYNITKNWKISYSGNKEIVWSLKLDIDSNKEFLSGNGEIPNNWNDLVELILEYETIFNNQKKKEFE